MTPDVLSSPLSPRKRLSSVINLFDFNFQDFDPETGNFGYKCHLLEVKEDGLVDSVGLWFSLQMDRERSLVMSNAPYSFGATAPGSCAAAGALSGNRLDLEQEQVRSALN